MHKRATVLLVALLGLGLVATAGNSAKVRILDKGNVIEVSENALQAHLGHGDEIMVLHNGELITESELAAILEAEAATEPRSNLDDLVSDYEQDQDANPDGDGAEEGAGEEEVEP